ncbi:MAG: hypothetical protein GX456_11810 [Verrucomicrobia bacterium]|nr:hypothetical protein [Verrucomicrobiota bacterium]
MLQLEFAEALLHAAKNAGLHCCVETSGHAAWAVLDRLRPVVDLWLFDYKETDPARHARFTGRELTIVLKRIEQLHPSSRRKIMPGSPANGSNTPGRGANRFSFPRWAILRWAGRAVARGPVFTARNSPLRARCWRARSRCIS